jgi:hypothetical protein
MTAPHRPGDVGTTTTRSLTAATERGARVIDLADLDWCWSQLRSTTHGVLSSRSPRKAVSLDVSYVVEGQNLVIPVAWDHEVLHLLAGCEVALGLSGREPDGLRWVVRVTGVAALSLVPSSSGTYAASRRSHPALGVDSQPSSALLLPVERLRGYHETPLDPNPQEAP